ncbi:Phenolphthiocerol synthesis polyketide synthase type I Pks15/1 [Poriferisphaera corsica]|uniref:Phenolphthiocerol synthesis polyketide synthase type I Pks15/1 n=2 Tax=Poriferisphaera corsica TaxID=2528020 RepID=A0A517YW96_9BACT|nr:Phenolphthiocerol synthesis polyketide synthase type I Pks15/1 [Poriferisphaera corsica]
MRAVLQNKTGLGSLELGEMEKPEVGDGELLVKVVCCGLNPVDYKLAEGGMKEWAWPHVPGVDVAGVVEEVGEGCGGEDGYEGGEAVMVHNDIRVQGGLGEYVVVKGHVVSRMPEGVSFEQAAALPCAGMTALLALDRKVGMVEGDTVLIQAGAGGVGGFGIQIAKRGGMRVIATCSGGNVDYVKGLGADEVIDYTKEDVAEGVRALTDGRGVDVVLDTLGGDAGMAALEMIAFGGHVAHVVGMADASGINGFARGYSQHAITLGGAYLSGDYVAQCVLKEMGETLLELVLSGDLDAMVGEVVGLEGAIAGLERLKEGHVRGKIVVRI